MPPGRRIEASYREVYADPARDSASAGLPLLAEIEMLGHDRFPRAKRFGLPLHRHPAAFEICYVVDGQLYWHLAEKTYSLRRGDVFVTPPNEPHGGEDAVMQPCEIFWLQVAIPAAGQALPGMTRRQTASIYDALIGASASPAFASEAPGHVESAFAALMREHRDSNAGIPLCTVAARGALQTLLVQIVRDAARSTAVRGSVSLPLRRALRWMESHLGEPFTIDAAASAAELSIAAFHDRFQREVGTTPAEWRTRKRIEHAKTWLIHNPEESVTHIALMLGFSSSQYFATAFKRYTAHTPTEYRHAHQMEMKV
jgi:AraC-like DNA-binding protein/mannose-6-phosphate isomerase-like protein (cupin superfamily)